MREMISMALADAGRPDKAYLAADPAAAMMCPPLVLPGGAQAVRFDSFPHSASSFYVGIFDESVFYLTEAPEAFTAMMRASGFRVASPGDAITVARCYVETTRSMSAFSRVVDSVNDIEWASGPLAPRPQDLSALIGRLRGIVTPPSAEARGGDYLATLYVLRGSTLERRKITIARDGNIRDRSDRVAKNLPVPISM
jgi:hypothetical protein